MDNRAVDRNDQLFVYVRFYIETDGSISDVKAIETNNEKLAKETVRVIKSSKGKWTPRKVHGVPQRTAYDYRLRRSFHE